MTNTKEKSFLSHSMAKWGLFIGALFALWFGGWFMFASFADEKIGETLASLKQRGVDIACDNRAIKGFPFRIGVNCEGVVFSNERDGLRVESGALRTTAILYAPGEMIAELDSPLKLSPGGVETIANLKIMRVFADANFSGGFDLVSLTYSKFNLQSKLAKLTIGEGGLHLRPTPTNSADLDIAGNANDVAALLNQTLNIPPATLSFDAVVADGYRKLIEQRHPLPQMLLEGVKVTLRSAKLKVAEGGQLILSGPLQLHKDGTLSGKINIGIAKPEAVTAWAGRVSPQFQQIVALVGQSVAGMGKPTKFGTEELRSITITIERGIARLGFIQLGQISSLKIN